MDARYQKLFETGNMTIVEDRGAVQERDSLKQEVLKLRSTNDSYREIGSVLERLYRRLNIPYTGDRTDLPRVQMLSEAIVALELKFDFANKKIAELEAKMEKDSTEGT